MLENRTSEEKLILKYKFTIVGTILQLSRNVKTSEGHYLEKRAAAGSADAPNPALLYQEALGPIQKASRKNTTLSTMGPIDRSIFSVHLIMQSCSLTVFHSSSSYSVTTFKLSYKKYHCSYHWVDCRGTHCSLLNCRPSLLSWTFLGIN